VSDIPFTVTDVDNVTYVGGEDPVEVSCPQEQQYHTAQKRHPHRHATGNDRNIDLTPYLKWNGTTTVTITAADLDGLKSTACFVLIVNNINDTPVAEDDTARFRKTRRRCHVLANDTDADLLTNPETESIRIKTVTSEIDATIELAADHLSVLVTPDANYNAPRALPIRSRMRRARKATRRQQALRFRR
jgi:hypothetical protein